MESLLNTDLWLSKPRIVAGVMTGTSMDGIDVALAKFAYNEDESKPSMEILCHKVYDFPEKVISAVKDCIVIHSKNQMPPSKYIAKANHLLGNAYSESLIRIIRESDFTFKDIAAVGIHGQTVAHFNSAGQMITLQIGSAPLTSVKLGIPVVFDFRSADIAAGGQGAPLVPIFDKAFLSKTESSVIALNVGGISNITYLPALIDSNSKVIAFDTGPGNCIIDKLAERFFHIPFDKNGGIASGGKVIDKLLKTFMDEEYIYLAPPKTSHTDYWLSKINDLDFQADPVDLLATFTEFTAQSIAENIRNFVPASKEVVISGGGALNNYLVERLSFYLSGSKIIKSDKLGIPSDAKEALCFAFLAWLRLAGFPGNVPSATGASHETKLGSISFA